jgi:hypothetical protein
MPSGRAITLNGVDYITTDRDVRLNGATHKVPVEEYQPEVFVEQFDTSGGQSQQQLRGKDSKVHPNFNLGLGRNRVASDSARNLLEYRRFRDATADTRFIDVRLPILSEPTTHTGLEVLRAMADFKGNVWGLWEDTSSADIISRDLTGATLAWGNGGTVSTGTTAVALDLFPHKNKLFAMYAINNDIVVEFSTDAATWTPATTTIVSIDAAHLANSVTANEDIDAGLLEEIGGLLVAVIWDETDGTVTFFSSVDGGVVWVDQGNDIASGNGPQGVAVMNGIDNADKLYVCLREGLFEIDTATSGSWTNRKVFSLTAHTDNGRRMSVHSDGALWFAQGVDDDSVPIVYQLFTAEGVRRFEVVPNDLGSGDGVVTEMLGPIRAMFSSGGFMYAAMGGGKAARNARIVAHNDGGWHTVLRHGTANEEVEPIFLTGEDDGTPRLLYAIRTSTSATTAKFLGQPNANPRSGVTINRESSGYLDMPFIDGGMPLISGAWLRIGVSAEDLSSSTSGEYIDVKYGKDGEARTVNDAGDILSGTSELRLPSATRGLGEASKALAARLVLNRDDTDPTFDATSNGSGSGTSVTLSHTVANVANRVIIVGIATENTTSEAAGIPTGITYNSVAMTKLGDSTFASTNSHAVSLWYLVAAATGANDIVASFSASMGDINLAAWSYNGVDQTNPMGTMVTDLNASGTAPSILVAGAVGDGAVCYINWEFDAADTITVGSGQTEDDNEGAVNLGSGGSHQTSATTFNFTTMSWTINNSREYALIGAIVKGAGDNTNTPAVQDVVVTYLKQPPVQDGFIETVDIDNSATIQNKKGNAVWATLETAVALGTLVTYRGPEDTTDRYIKIRNIRGLPTFRSGARASPRTTSDPLIQRSGYAVLTITEVDAD